MRFNPFRRRRKISYANPKVRAQSNPYFPGHSEQGRALWKNKLFTIEVALTILLFAYIIGFSPLFRITQIQIEGGPEMQGKYLSMIERILRPSRFLLLFPGDNYLFLRPGWLSRSLIKTNEGVTTFKAITITKVFPNIIKINVQEKTVSSIWSSNDINYGIDDAGFIIHKYQYGEMVPALKKYVDKNNFSVKLNDQVISEEALASSKLMVDAIAALGFVITDINIPEQSCVVKAPVSPTDASESLNDAEINSNTNDNILVAPEISEPCDPRALAFASHEMHAAIENGPSIYFLRDNIESQIEKLRITLQDVKLDLRKLSYIDIRFGERVYYK